MKKKKTVIKSTNTKVKKFQYRSLIAPIFALLTLNLIFSVGLNVKGNTNPKNINEDVTTISNKNTIVANVPDNADALYIFNLANNNLNNSKNVTIHMNGDIDSVVNQRIVITKMYDGKIHFTENINTGFKNNASRVYYNKNNQTEVTIVKGTNIKPISANWSNKPTTMSYQKFKNNYVVTPEMYMPYNISAVTVTSATPVTKQSNGDYTFTLNLHPTLATKLYGESVKKVLDLKDKPEFTSIVVNVTIDKDLNFKTIIIKEEYKIKWLGIRINCNSTITSNFNFKTKVVIPPTQ